MRLLYHISVMLYLSHESARSRAVVGAGGVRADHRDFGRAQSSFREHKPPITGAVIIEGKSVPSAIFYPLPEAAGDSGIFEFVEYNNRRECFWLCFGGGYGGAVARGAGYIENLCCNTLTFTSNML